MMEHGGGNAVSAATSSSREVGVDGDYIKLNVFHGSNHYDLSIPSQSTFGDLKRLIAQATGLEPEVQNLLFRGKEKDDHEPLHMAGVKDNAKVIVMENSANKEKDLGEIEDVRESIEEISRGSEAVALLRVENDNLADQVAALDAVVCSGTQVADKDIIYLTEMLMRQLLKLDGVDAEGEGRVQRKMEVRRVQSLVETMDNLKAKNSNPSSIISSSAPVTAQSEANEGITTAQPSTPSTKITQEWEVFESPSVNDNSSVSATVHSKSNDGNTNAQSPMPSSTKVTQEWEVFE